MNGNEMYRGNINSRMISDTYHRMSQKGTEEDAWRSQICDALVKSEALQGIVEEVREWLEEQARSGTGAEQVAVGVTLRIMCSGFLLGLSVAKDAAICKKPTGKLLSKLDQFKSLVLDYVSQGDREAQERLGRSVCPCPRCCVGRTLLRDG